MTSMYEERYWAAQKALDEILGAEEEDGAGEGLVAEIWHVAHQRDNALAEVERLRAWIYDHAPTLIGSPDPVAGVLNLIEEGWAENGRVRGQRNDLADERDALAARLERAERVAEVAPVVRNVIEALRMLVELKDGPRNDAYYRAKDSAWAAARICLRLVDKNWPGEGEAP